MSFTETGTKKGMRAFRSIVKSRFVRSVFFRVLSIFIIVSVAIVGIAFFSFTSEIRKKVLADRYKQLAVVEDTISKRMDEILSIAYSISDDSTFLLEPVAVDHYSGYQMSSTLSRYLAGNSFIEHLAFYRLSEPDKICISSGERSLYEFFTTSFGLDEKTAEENIRHIRETTETTVIALTYGEAKNSYFAYLYPLPQLSAHPKAFVLMLIPIHEVKPLLDTLLVNGNGEAAVFDASGNEIYRMGSLGDSLPLAEYARSDETEIECATDSGEKCVLQKVVSQANGWTYISVIRQSDMLSGLANKQLLFILLLLLLVFISIIAMLASIVRQYKPISNLAATVAQGGQESVDERVLLKDTIVSLKDDSRQKQRFETAYYEAEAASKAKSTFLSNMSHDIRTPRNAIVGMTAIALKHADDPTAVRECLHKVQTSSQYLLDIINNVLDMSRIESGRFTLSSEPIDLPALISGLSALIEPSVAAKGQIFTVRVGTLRHRVVTGDNMRLTQVFINILSNAVKFTPEGGEISLDVRQTESDSPEYGNFVFIFKDNGIGMSQEFVTQVFDTFSRAKDADVSKVEGTGLGMAIAKNLVELMGGSIACESAPGRGTTFTVTLRMKLAANDALPAGAAAVKDMDAQEQTIDLTGRRILLAEDNAINREIACRILRETGANVTEAADGREAVSVFSDSPVDYFDIILMDIQMPVMNGYEATAAIRALQKEDAKRILIYAMTANTFDEDVRQVRDAGMNGHIGKPYTPAALYRTLKQALNA